MKILKLFLLLLVIGAAAFAATRIINQPAAGEAANHDDDHDHGEDTEGGEGASGDHGGRLLGDADFQCEVVIYEPEGMAPEFRVYCYKDGKPIDPGLVTLNITLERLNRTETVRFQKKADHLAGEGSVAEPHSFHGTVRAEYDGRSYEWKFDSIEGRTELAAEIVAKAGIEMQRAGKAEIRETIPLRGLVKLNAERMAHVTPRFPGIVRSVVKNLGDTVRKGEVLATIESNESLRPYEVKAEIDGTILQKDATLGEAVDSQQSLFTIADLSTVWVDFTAHRNDFPLLKAGQSVAIDMGEGESIPARIDYLSPLSAEASQTMLARCVVANADGALRPGLFVLGKVTVAAEEVPVAVKASALQTFRERDVVFLRVGDTFEATPVEIGRRDDQWIEIKEGLPAGSEYAADNSFIIKADIMKSGAVHEH